MKKVHFKANEHLTLCGKHYTDCDHPYYQKVNVGGVTTTWRYVTCKACKKHKSAS